jgi:PAS domain S-box-containing protein
MRERKMMYVLILIMITTCAVVSGIPVYLLYKTSFEQQQERLMTTAQSQARLIEAVARFNVLHQERWHPQYGDPADATLIEIIDAHKHYVGFGKTGEFTLARRDGDNIVFLLRHRHSSFKKPKQMRFDSNLAEPMRLALSGKPGTVVGLDYRGMTVVAAYEPVAHLNLGIVAKIDLSEIRAPFVRAGIITGVLSVLAVVVSVLLFLRISNPIIRILEDRTLELEKMNEKLIQEIGDHKRSQMDLHEAKDLLSNTFDALQDSVMVIDKDFRVRMSNWKSHDYISEKDRQDHPYCYEVFLNRNKPCNPCHNMEVFATGQIKQFENINPIDGKTRDIRVLPMFDDEGKVISVIEHLRDITDLKRSEKALVESEQRFRNLIENSPLGLSIIQNNQIVYQNPEQERLLGPLPRKPLFSDREYIHPDDVEKLRQFHQAVISGEVPAQDIDFRFYYPDNTNNRLAMKWVQCRARIIEYQGEEAILVYNMDVSRSKELERLLRIQDKMFSLGRVAAGIAHEIRNPLSGINIYVNTLEKIYDKRESLEKVKEILGKIQSASIKIETVIRRVMDFSKPSELKFVLTDINKPIKEAVNLSEVTLRKRGIEIKKALASDLPLCQADPNLIEQVILNLINNATEAMQDMKEGKKIEITSSIGKDCIFITVSDSGPGVPLAMKDQLFDPFYSTKSSGTGIGLSITHRIITDHGGSMDISESRWNGAEFRIELPIKKGIGDS